MTISSNGASGAPAGLTAVAVADIPLALARRWKTIMAENPDAGSRASSLNLVIYADEVEAGPAVSSIVGELAATHPIRAITVIADDAAAEDAVEASIAAGCSGAGGTRPPCSEEIFLRANPRAAERAASAAYGLLAADMPVYLWWRGASPYGNVLFTLIAPFAHKIIVDSMRFGDTSAALDTVRRLAAHRPGHVAVADLNWKRTRPWRTSIAGCFDDRSALALLAQFDRCEIKYACLAGDPTPPAARATLMAGWLSSRLPRLRRQTRVTSVKITDDGAGRIESIAFTSSKSKASLGLQRSLEPLGIDARVCSADGVELRTWSFAAATRSEAELLHHCLDDPSHDPVFEAALTQE